MEPVEKANRQAATIMKALDVGSGVDVENLARTLADVESSSRINATNTKMASVESRLSGYAVVSSFLDNFKNKFEGLQNVTDLFTSSATSSDSARVAVSVTGDVLPAQYTVTVQSLASSTIIQSANFLASDSALNNGVSFDVGLQIGSADISTITVTEDTPAGLVAAINAKGLGVRATLVNKSASGNDWQIVLRGNSGAAADFNITSSSAAVALGFGEAGNRLATAQDAEITVNGMSGIRRSSNQISDVISGVKIDLNANPDNEISIVVGRSSQPIQAKLQAVIDAYNQFNTALTELGSNEVSETEPLAGSLKRDKQFLNSLRSQIKDLLTQDSPTSAGGYGNLRDIGLSFRLDGTAELNAQRLDLALASNEDAVATMLSAGTNNDSNFSALPKGLAQTVSIRLAEILNPSGIINQRKVSGETQISVYKADLVKLEVRLEAVYQRYLSQFSAMESLVERMQGIGDYLKGQFTAMENMYKK